MTTVIVDLDVLADSRWRDDLRPAGGDSDWSAYHAAGSRDLLDLHALILVTGLRRMDSSITIVSHRPEAWLLPAAKWMHEYLVPADRLVFRPTGDFRTNAEIVADLIAREPKPHFVILGDDERVIEAVRATGVFIVQVHRP